MSVVRCSIPARCLVVLAVGAVVEPLGMLAGEGEGGEGEGDKEEEGGVATSS